MKFEYNGRIYSPSNLEKKLQKMGITINDIKIIEDSKKEEIKEYDDEFETVNLITHLDNLKRVVRVPRGTRPNPVEYLKKYLWDPITKTGIKEYTIEFLQTLKYEN